MFAKVGWTLTNLRVNVIGGGEGQSMVGCINLCRLDQINCGRVDRRWGRKKFLLLWFAALPSAMLEKSHEKSFQSGNGVTLLQSSCSGTGLQFSLLGLQFDSINGRS